MTRMTQIGHKELLMMRPIRVIRVICGWTRWSH
jgi:hypothetical protein